MNEHVNEKKTGTNDFIGGVGAIYIPVSDTWKSKKWYEEVLGLNWCGHCFIFGENQPSLFLIETKNQAKPSFNFMSKDDYEMFVVTLNMRSKELFEEFYHRLKEMGVEIEDIENRGLCGENFRIYDPDGNKIDIYNTDYQHETHPQWEEEK